MSGQAAGWVLNVSQPANAPQAQHFTQCLGLYRQHPKRLAPLLESLDRLPPELQALQAQIGASGRTIGRIFQRETGMSYQQWRQQWRLMRAIELLATGRTISYSAFELGFASDSAFIAFFKAMTGVTPGA